MMVVAEGPPPPLNSSQPVIILPLAVGSALATERSSPRNQHGYAIADAGRTIGLDSFLIAKF